MVPEHQRLEPALLFPWIFLFSSNHKPVIQHRDKRAGKTEAKGQIEQMKGGIGFLVGLDVGKE